MARPERSDAHLPPEEARRIEDEARRYYEEMKPKRHPKPARSDPSIDDVTEGEGLIYEGGEVVDDYIETAYCVRLQVIDKQHHTTGTGFIKMDKPNGSDLNLKPISTNVSQASCKWNPATNDWVPEANQQMIPVSRKPNRSDS
ncbi:hypothetical protein HPP92_012206 [Vanilla planifolia]|uniref:Uncharacterized protein n=1 Tax=Vanilla planifolia TaxID=51239 RepID=A0A835RDV6_VANPL|nr:hypothetical protein HPP92_012206 [Vanilla planifolia]